MSCCKDGRTKNSAKQTFLQVTENSVVNAGFYPAPCIVHAQVLPQLHVQELQEVQSQEPVLHAQLLPLWQKQLFVPQLLGMPKVAVAVNLNLKTFSGNCFIKELAGA